MSLQQDALKVVLANLSQSMVYTEDTNVATNRKLWNQYAKSWKSKESTPTSNTTNDVKSSNYTHENNDNDDNDNDNDYNNDTNENANVDNEWLIHMAENVGRDRKDLEYLGDEWSDPNSLTQVLEEYLYPLLLDHSSITGNDDDPTNNSDNNGNINNRANNNKINQHDITSVQNERKKKTLIACEIGIGGARIASKTLPRVSKLYGFDISENMLIRSQKVLMALASSSSSSSSCPFELELLTGDVPSFPAKYHNMFDVVYSFDVFPHLDLHTIAAYLKQIKLILKANGRVLLHVADITKPLGWKRFSQQKKPTAGGFYFQSPDIIQTLVKQNGFVMLKSSSAFDGNGNNLYYNRDFLFVLGLDDK